MTRGAARLALASPDYRAGLPASSLRPVSAQGSEAPLPHLAVTDVPGQYAYEDSTQGQRLAQRQMQAIDARRDRATARGPWREAAPGTHFVLCVAESRPQETGQPERLCGLRARCGHGWCRSGLIERPVLEHGSAAP